MKSRELQIYKARLTHRFECNYMEWKKNYPGNTDTEKFDHFAMYNINRIAHELEREVLDVYLKDGAFTPDQLQDVIMDIHFKAFQLMEALQGRSTDDTINKLIHDIFNEEDNKDEE